MPRWNNKNCGFQKGHKDFVGEIRKPHSKETKRKISKKKKGKPNGRLGEYHTEETKKKIGLANSNPSEETKEKMRKAVFKYAKEMAGIICPRIGRNEKVILDKLENRLGYKIIRQYKCEGYFIDGYISKLKLAIEVDEIPKNREKDIGREGIIKESLGCQFLRIKDYD